MQPNYGTFCAGGDYAIGSVNNSNAAKTVTSAVFDDRRLFPKLRGREMQAELFADELTEISDNGSNDWMERTKQNGEIEVVLVEARHRPGGPVHGWSPHDREEARYRAQQRLSLVGRSIA